MRYAGKLDKRRPGVIAPMVAVALVGLLAFAALAIDGGLLLADRRNLQAVADAAALAAAIDLYNNYATNNGTDPNGTAATSAQDTAKDNGYTNGKNNVTVTVNIPPASGTYSGKAGYAEVIITMQQTRFFSNVLGTGNVNVSARAVAVGGSGPDGNALIVLNSGGNNTLNVTHSGSVNITNGGNIVVDSTSKTGLTLSSTGNVQADNVYVNGPLESPNPGGYGTNTGAVILNSSTQVQTGSAQDPFKKLSEPTVPTPDYGSVSISGSNFSSPGNQTSNGHVFATVSGNTMTLNPGYYSGGLTVNDNSTTHTFILSSGVYFFGANVQFSSFGGTMTDNGAGVLWYFKSGGFTYSANSAGSPSINLSAITSGTYAGYPVLYQYDGNPYATSPNTSNFTMSGGGNINVTGTVYLPFANSVNFSHTGTMSVTGRMVVNTFQLSNTGNLNISYVGPPSYAAGVLYLVE